MEPEDADAQVAGWSEWMLDRNTGHWSSWFYVPNEPLPRGVRLDQGQLEIGIIRQTTCGSCDPDHPDWDGDTCCIEGRIYGPCEYEGTEEYGTCSGLCVSEGDCQCVCHAEPSKAG